MNCIVVFFATVTITAYGAPANNCNNSVIRTIGAINNNFGKGLLDILSNNEGNVFFSPSSLTSILSAIFYGAKENTAEDLVGLAYLSIQYEQLDTIDPRLGYCFELLKTLRSTSDEYTLERANAVLIQKNYPVLEEYKDRLRKSFGTIIKNVDFSRHSDEAVEEVNRWVREKTHGKISKLVDDLDEATKLLLLSAIYFKGTWQTEFDPENTKPRPFYNNGNSSPKSVPTMQLKTKFPYLYDEANQYRALQLPYKGNDVSMIILLPFERDGIEKLQQSITSETLFDVLDRVRETEVIVSLPKFKIEYYKSLKEDLTTAGFGAMFSTDADLSGITGNKDLYVSDVIHKAVIEINEEGSEAAAVTGAIVVPLSLEIPSDRNVFDANHPFLFFIVDKRSGSNLFVGRVTEF